MELRAVLLPGSTKGSSCLEHDLCSWEFLPAQVAPTVRDKGQHDVSSNESSSTTRREGMLMSNTKVCVLQQYLTELVSKEDSDSESQFFDSC